MMHKTVRARIYLPNSEHRKWKKAQQQQDCEQSKTVTSIQRCQIIIRSIDASTSYIRKHRSESVNRYAGLGPSPLAGTGTMHSFPSEGLHLRPRRSRWLSPPVDCSSKPG